MNIPNTHSLKKPFTIALITALVVLIAGFIIKAGGTFEMPLSEALNTLHHGFVGTLGNALYKGIGPVPAIVGTALITAIILIVSRSIAKASTFAVTIAVTWLSTAVVKLLVHMPRPDASLLAYPYHPIQTDASYPSGHAAFITALVVTTFLLVVSVQAKRTVAIIGGIVIVVTWLLLTIDAVHFPTDVIASTVWVIGVAPFVYHLWVGYVLPWILKRVKLPAAINQ